MSWNGFSCIRRHDDLLVLQFIFKSFLTSADPSVHCCLFSKNLFSPRLSFNWFLFLSSIVNFLSSNVRFHRNYQLISSVHRFSYFSTERCISVLWFIYPWYWGRISFSQFFSDCFSPPLISPLFLFLARLLNRWFKVLINHFYLSTKSFLAQRFWFWFLSFLSPDQTHGTALSYWPHNIFHFHFEINIVVFSILRLFSLTTFKGDLFDPCSCWLSFLSFHLQFLFSHTLISTVWFFVRFRNFLKFTFWIFISIPIDFLSVHDFSSSHNPVLGNILSLSKWSFKLGFSHQTTTSVVHVLFLLVSSSLSRFPKLCEKHCFSLLSLFLRIPPLWLFHTRISIHSFWLFSSINLFTNLRYTDWVSCSMKT